MTSSKTLTTEERLDQLEKSTSRLEAALAECGVPACSPCSAPTGSAPQP